MTPILSLSPDKLYANRAWLVKEFLILNRDNSHSAALLVEIDKFLSITGMGACYLGLIAVGNGHIVARLRRGGDVRLRTSIMLRRFMNQRLADWEHDRGR